VDVFTDRRFGGNQLAVFPDARGLADAEMQALATELNLSETTFVLPPEDPAHTARVRIFNRAYEMPFAGHPNVGTGYVLAEATTERLDVLLFEELAGLVQVRIDRNHAGKAVGATIAAPQPLSLGVQLPAEAVAACVSLESSEVLTGAHPPVLASVGNPFVIAEVSPEALSRAVPEVSAFRRVRAEHSALEGRVALNLYARAGRRLRARMFSPLSGTVEDAATGSANAPLVGLLLSLSDDTELTSEVVQGVEMGRPSLLRVTARRETDGIRTTVGGGCVPVLRGEAML
jgi:trans-2,3-dihydro-3-hydroxyanthranilate isomerase